MERFTCERKIFLMNSKKQFEKFAFKMQLKPGQAEVYKQRHDDIWPELSELLRNSGISDYSIFLDEDTDTLFGVLWREEHHKMDQLPEHEIMQRWWQFMGDLMETNPDGSPKADPLRLIFHLQ